jgi:hypothetical protein
VRLKPWLSEDLEAFQNKKGLANQSDILHEYVLDLKNKATDLEAWKSRALFLEAFMKKRGIPATPKAPELSKPEPKPIRETQETKEELLPVSEKTEPIPTDPVERQFVKVECPIHQTVKSIPQCEAIQKSRPDLCKAQNCPNINSEIIADLKTKIDPVELVQ